MNWYDNELCDICQAYWRPSTGEITMDVYWINTHCIELRRNRVARLNKCVTPTKTAF